MTVCVWNGANKYFFMMTKYYQRGIESLLDEKNEKNLKDDSKTFK